MFHSSDVFFIRRNRGTLRPTTDSEIEEIPRKIFFKIISEKKDLVELVIRQNGVGEASGSNPNTEKPRRIPQERQKSFPKSYVESTHRHEWMEKMENAQEATEENIVCEETDDDFIVVTSVEPMEVDGE